MPQQNGQRSEPDVKLKSVKRRSGGVPLCLVQAKEDNEPPETLQRFEVAAGLVVMETAWVDLSYQQDIDGWDKNFTAFVKE